MNIGPVAGVGGPSQRIESGERNNWVMKPAGTLLLQTQVGIDAFEEIIEGRP